MKKRSPKISMKKNALWAVILPLTIIAIAVILDFIYHNWQNVWMSDKNIVGKICIYFWKIGFRYSTALERLKNNFGSLVTTVSIIITMSIHNLNRLETRFLGLVRSRFDFSIRRMFYSRGRIMILLAPFFMIIAVVFDFCLTGYTILIFCYTFIVTSYLLFEKSFDTKHDLDSIGKMLYEKVPEHVRDYEDIVEYRMLLDEMRQWNDKEKRYENVLYLFRWFFEQPEETPLTKDFVLYCFFYRSLLIGSNRTNCEQAVNALMEYITNKDNNGWDTNSYIILWGMMQCLFLCDDRENILLFIKWYTDFPARYRRLSEKSGLMDDKKPPASMQATFFRNTQMQAGILLTEFELFLRHHPNPKEIGVEIWEKIPALWSEGKIILTGDMETFRDDYLRISRSYNLNTDTFEKGLENLCLDLRYGSAMSLTVSHLRYKEELHGNHM